MDVREIDPNELYLHYSNTSNRQGFVERVVEEYKVSFPDREQLHRYWDIIDAAIDLGGM